MQVHGSEEYNDDLMQVGVMALIYAKAPAVPPSMLLYHLGKYPHSKTR